MLLSEVLSSKIYVKENGSVDFRSPSAYIEPFLDAVRFNGRESDVTIKTQGDVTNSNESGTMNIAYPRVNVEVKTNHSTEGFQSIIGMIYALDLQKPEIKIYTGQNAHACTNLTIFNADGVFSQSLLGGFGTVYSHATEYLNRKEAEAAEFKKIHEYLCNTFLTTEELNRELGRLLRASSKTKIGSSPIVQASNRLDDRESIYYVKPDAQCSLMNFYDAITQSFTNSKNILDRPTQTVQLSRLFNLFNN